MRGEIDAAKVLSLCLKLSYTAHLEALLLLFIKHISTSVFKCQLSLVLLVGSDEFKAYTVNAVCICLNVHNNRHMEATLIRTSIIFQFCKAGISVDSM